MRHQFAALSAAITLSLAIPTPGLAQQQLSPLQVTQDVRFLIRTLEETHPDPYTALGGKVEFKRRVRELLTSIPAEGLDISGVYTLLARFVADLSDGHTSLSEPQLPDHGSQARLLPLRFSVSADAVFVSGATMGFEGLVGTRLIAADGVSIDALLEVAGQVFPTENWFGRARNLARAIRSTRYSTALFGGLMDTLRLQLEHPAGLTITENVAFLDRGTVTGADWTTGGTRRAIEAGDGPIWWTLLEPENAAYLRLESIVGAESFLEARSRTDLPGYVERYYERYLGSNMPTDLESALAGIPCFTKTVTKVLEAMRAANAEHLIVDVRSNGGGWSSLMEPLYLLAFGTEYLDYPFPDMWVDVASPQLLDMNAWTAEELAATWGSDFEVGDYRFEVDGSPRGGRTLTEYAQGLRTFGCSLAETSERLKGEPLYRPTVIVLVDSGTFSAAYQLAYRLWRLGAVVVGVPSSQAGNAFTNVVRIELPNSKLTGSVARSAQMFFPHDPALGRVLRPEFPVDWLDFARFGFDSNTTLLYALELIADGRITRRGVRLP